MQRNLPWVTNFDLRIFFLRIRISYLGNHILVNYQLDCFRSLIFLIFFLFPQPSISYWPTVTAHVNPSLSLWHPLRNLLSIVPTNILHSIVRCWFDLQAVSPIVSLCILVLVVTIKAVHLVEGNLQVCEVRRWDVIITWVLKKVINILRLILVFFYEGFLKALLLWLLSFSP